MRTYPESFLARMRLQLGAEYPAFFDALQQPPRRALRVNLLKTDFAELSALLDMPLVPLEENPYGAAVPEGFNPNATPLHAAGLFYMQEACAQAPVAALELPDEPVVLDLCAAPGGKSAHLLSKMRGGLLLSNEIVPSRAYVLAGNLERMGATNAIALFSEPHPLCLTVKDRCDAVVVDAPCSGEAMFRKDERAVAEWSPAHVAACAVRQHAILTDAALAVKPGGQLLYSTCSFAPQENELTVDRFLDEHPDFTCVKMKRLYPHTSAGEGQFYALFVRDGEREPAVFSQWDSQKIPAFEAFRPQLKPLSGAVASLKDGRVLLIPPMPFSIAGLHLVRAGLLLGECVGNRFEPAHALAMAGKETPLRATVELTFDEAMRYLRGETLAKEAEKGYGAVTYRGHALGLYKASDGLLKNRYPKGLRLYQ